MPLSPDQAQDVIDHFCDLRSAAKVTGIPRSTLWAWANPKRHREQCNAAAVRLRESRKAKGLCMRCGAEPPLSEAVCWTCLNDMEEHRAIAL